MSMVPAGNILIPRIGEKIAAVLRRHKLRPEVSPKKFLARVKTSKHRYFTPARTPEGTTVAFYARLHANPDAQRKFLTEVSVLRRLNRMPQPFARSAPRLLSAGRESSFEWFTREHINGNPLGHSRHLSGRLAASTVAQLASSIVSIGQLPPKELRVKLPRFNPDNYRIDRQCYGLAQAAAVPATTCRGVGRLVSNNRQLLHRCNRVVAHGDLNLGNILVDGGIVRIVDWELAQLNNLAYDLGYLWVHLWEAPKRFRQLLLQSFVRQLPSPQRALFRQLLPVVVAYLAIGGIPYRRSAHERHAEQERRRRYHVRLLQQCLHGFSALRNA